MSRKSITLSQACEGMIRFRYVLAGAFNCALQQSHTQTSASPTHMDFSTTSYQRDLAQSDDTRIRQKRRFKTWAAAIRVKPAQLFRLLEFPTLHVWRQPSPPKWIAQSPPD